MYDVFIKWIDGEIEVVEAVTRDQINEGVLHLYQDPNPGELRSPRHLGSFPIRHIRVYRRIFPDLSI